MEQVDAIKIIDTTRKQTMRGNYYLSLSYAVKDGGGAIRHYRGIFANNKDRKYYFNVKRTNEFEFDANLKLETLRKYEAEIYTCKFHVRDAYNAIKSALKRMAGGVAVRDVDIMRVEAQRAFPEDFKGAITYERAERVIGKAI